MSAISSEGKLAVAEKYYQHYGDKARELKREGRKLIGYLCAYTPVEMIKAAELVPFRIIGNVEDPITVADTEMESIVCPLVRGAFDRSLKGKYEFLDGLVIPHGCDSMSRTYDIWKDTLGLSYNHMLNLPHGTDDSSLRFFSNILETFRDSLARFSGKKITDERLKKAIETYNRMRSRVRALYELRRTDPPQISGSEVTKLLVAGGSIPVETFSDLLAGVIDEVRDRVEKPAEKLPRIMVVGAEVDNVNIIDLIEGSGAVVVTDDACPGTREFFPQVSLLDSPIEALAGRYLKDINCARTYRERDGTYEDYLELRFGHIGQAIREFNVEGVILYIYRYCDPFGFEVPQIKSYIEAKGIPVLYLEDGYFISNTGGLRTRIQAFLEIIG